MDGEDFNDMGMSPNGRPNSCSATVMHCTQCFTVELQLWPVSGQFFHWRLYAHGRALIITPDICFYNHFPFFLDFIFP